MKRRLRPTARNRRGCGTEREDNVALSDAEALRRFRAGDNDGFEVIVERYKKRVLAFLLRYFNLTHRAEDVMQLTFFRFYRRVTLDPSFCLKEETVQALLVRIAGDAAIDALREEGSRDRAHNALALFSAAELLRQAPSASAAEIRLDVNRALAKVPDDLQHVGRLRFRDGHSAQDVALLTDLPVTTVVHRIRRVRQLLIHHLRDYV